MQVRRASTAASGVPLLVYGAVTTAADRAATTAVFVFGTTAPGYRAPRAGFGRASTAADLITQSGTEGRATTAKGGFPTTGSGAVAVKRADGRANTATGDATVTAPGG